MSHSAVLNDGSAMAAPHVSGSPSLLVRIALLLAGLLLGLGAVLYLAVERLVTREFDTVQNERAARQADDLARLLDAELRQVRGQAALAATDSDLVHSTHYHVRLRGEAKAAQQDVDRIAETLDFRRVSLARQDGAPIAQHEAREAAPVLPESTAAPASARAYALWVDGMLWLVGEAPVRNEGIDLARLTVLRPASMPAARGDVELTLHAVA
nr:hypothetical protein [Burkholderiaceae bacterium]